MVPTDPKFKNKIILVEILFKSDSHLPKQENCVICFIESPFKNDGKCFLFHFKSSFCSQDV